MGLRSKLQLALVLLVLLPFARGLAHHSHASLNDDDVRVFKGVVTRYSWRAPHVYIQARVVMDDGSVREYKVEALNPPAMSNLGWSKDSLKAGDVIVWEGAQDQDPDRAYAGINWADLPDGTRLYAGATDYRKSQQAQNARLEAVAVEPVSEIGSGSWVRIAADGGTHPPIRKPAGDWPLTPAYVEKVANWSEDDNPINNCVYGGPPRSIVSLSNFMWTRPDEHTILIDRDMWPEPRVIHLNADAPRAEPSSNGHSVGRFVGDELIVESDNFLAETWGLYTGIDSSAEKKLVERYWLSEGGMRLNVEFTVTDPVVLTRPYTYTHQWKRVPDRPLTKVPCSLEIAWLYKTADYGVEAEGVTEEIMQSILDEVASEAAAADTGKQSGKSLLWLLLAAVAIAVSGFFGWRMRRRT